MRCDKKTRLTGNPDAKGSTEQKNLKKLPEMFAYYADKGCEVRLLTEYQNTGARCNRQKGNKDAV